MEKGANSVCFLTSVMGEFAGLGEQVEIVDQQGFWILRGHQGRIGQVSRQRQSASALQTSHWVNDLMECTSWCGYFTRHIEQTISAGPLLKPIRSCGRQKGPSDTRSSRTPTLVL